MIKAFKRWLAKAAYDGLQEQGPQRAEVRTNKLHDMFQNNMAAMVAFKIDNGFVVRTMNPEDAYSGGRMPGFVYCADHQAIADHLVSSAMKDRLGVQQDMFAEQQRKQVNVIRKSQAAGLVGTQQANPSY
jgi:hypothetical protein